MVIIFDTGSVPLWWCGFRPEEQVSALVALATRGPVALCLAVRLRVVFVGVSLAAVWRLGSLGVGPSPSVL